MTVQALQTGARQWTHGDVSAPWTRSWYKASAIIAAQHRPAALSPWAPQATPDIFINPADAHAFQACA